MNMSGNTILITGGATGIGLELAEQLAAKGNEVIICGRREARLKEAQERIAGLHIRVCDVASQAEREDLYKWATTNFPKLNVLINNAGIQRDFDFLNPAEPWEVTRQEIVINVEAPIHLATLFAEHFKAVPDSSIINVSSGLAFMPMSLFPIYCATKAALHSISMTMRHQLAKAGIRVIEVIPPAVDSELNQEGRIKRGMTSTGTTAEEFVSAVMAGLERGDDEIGYGTSERGRRASRDEIDEGFKRMNR
ncbi:SDR family oxidoreductase [Alicyclobacillus ferrooxydans]|uniref:Cytochrome C n=1 Tax=Alicyclobacillus ferrooxydans TaxID=471514 RepID=A0A0P9EIQ9_9BACL|nr:SDR family NAD(P)-dependent oxidoreductase [Alicyclobacillus ferrooxydans]KPV42720.1 cytochrome C [Alicyclobacillus ferrooxydans]